MKKGYYIHDSLYENGKLIYPGVENKIASQILEFEKYFHMERLELLENEGSLQKIKKRLPVYKNRFNYSELLQRIEKPEFIYIRKPAIEAGLLVFLRKVKEKYPECKIVMELFTYPYDRDIYLKKELILKVFPVYLKEVWNRKRLWKYVDRVATYSRDKEIWNIKTIPVVNGIDISKIEELYKEKRDSDEINLISVASMQIHHGYDRLLEGIKQYYEKKPDRKVIYHVVGNGTEVDKYKGMVQNLHLEEYVKFYGMLSGKKLEEVYRRGDIAAASLGLHRIGITQNSTLKTREYLAKGIPFFYAGEVDVLEGKDIDFVMQVPADESPVDIKEIIKFYDYLESHYANQELTKKIRKFAEDNVSMEKAMQPVIDYLINVE